MKVTVRPALSTLEDYDRAIDAAAPAAEGLSERQRLTRFTSLANLLRGRSRVWRELADRYATDTRVPWELVTAARRCAGADLVQASRWERHRATVEERRR